MQEYIVPIIVAVIGLILCIAALIREFHYRDSNIALGLIFTFLGLGIILTKLTAPEYVETRFDVQSYQATTVDIADVRANGYTFILEDGSSMVVELKEIRYEGNKTELIQYDNKNLMIRKSYYILILPEPN